MTEIKLDEEFKKQVRQNWSNRGLVAQLFRDEAVRLGVLDEDDEKKSADLKREVEEKRPLGQFPTFEGFIEWLNRDPNAKPPPLPDATAVAEPPRRGFRRN